MEKEQLERKLTTMVGKTYLYMGENLLVNGYSVTLENVFISTDLKLLKFDREAASNKIKDMMPIDDKSRQAIEVRTVQAKHNVMSKIDSKNLIDIILDNIDKVRDDAKYINQANAVNSSVNTLLNIAKAELMFFKNM